MLCIFVSLFVSKYQCMFLLMSVLYNYVIVKVLGSIYAGP